jgi:hypothetical protein
VRLDGQRLIVRHKSGDADGEELAGLRRELPGWKVEMCRLCNRDEVEAERITVEFKE